MSHCHESAFPVKVTIPGPSRGDAAIAVHPGHGSLGEAVRDAVASWQAKGWSGAMSSTMTADVVMSDGTPTAADVELSVRRAFACVMGDRP